MKNIKGFFLIVVILFSCSENESVKKETLNNDMFHGSNKVNQVIELQKYDYLSLDELKIKLTPFIKDCNELPEASNLLKDKLNAAIVQLGYGGEDSNPRFILGPSVSLLSQNIMSTAPTNYMNTYEINFFVVDVVTKTVFNSYKLEFKGVGLSTEKALLNGLRKINLDKQAFFDFLKKADIKIEKFYKSNCYNIIQNAESEASVEHFDAAFTILSSIPSESSECFNKIKVLKKKYFKASVDKRCNVLLMSMKSELGKFKDKSGSGFNDEAMTYYALIDRKASCYKDAEIIYKNYSKNLKPKQKSDWQLKIKQYQKSFNSNDFNNKIDMKKLSQNQLFKLKLIEIQSKIEIEGNRRLLAKYKYDESPWLVKLCSSFSKLFKNELKTN